MVLALDACQDVGDVVEAPDQTWAEVKPLRPETRARRAPPTSGIQSGPKQIVHDDLERLPALADRLLQPGRDILVQGQRRSHIMMLSM